MLGAGVVVSFQILVGDVFFVVALILVVASYIVFSPLPPL